MYKDVISFASLYQSFASLTDVIMLSNWPMFMDAAGDVGGVVTARIFFYSFKISDWKILCTLCSFGRTVSGQVCARCLVYASSHVALLQYMSPAYICVFDARFGVVIILACSAHLVDSSATWFVWNAWFVVVLMYWLTHGSSPVNYKRGVALFFVDIFGDILHVHGNKRQ